MSSGRFVPTELTPMFLNGRWRKPALSAMQRAKLRKQAIVNGKYVVGAKLENNEWDPYWDKVPSFQVLQAAKGKAYERNQIERVANIQRLLKENPIKEAALKAEKEKKKDATPLEMFLKKHKLL